MQNNGVAGEDGDGERESIAMIERLKRTRQKHQTLLNSMLTTQQRKLPQVRQKEVAVAEIEEDGEQQSDANKSRNYIRKTVLDRELGVTHTVQANEQDKASLESQSILA